MSVESPINPDHGWFAGEDKILRFALRTGDDATGWGCTFSVYRRGSVIPLFTKTTAEGAISGTPGYVSVVVSGADTAALEDRSYTYILRRTDVGANSVLAYGPASIRQAVSA